MWNLSGIVGFQSDLQILGKPNVEGFLCNFALKDVDVEEGHVGLSILARLRPARRDFGAAAFALRFSEGWLAEP